MPGYWLKADVRCDGGNDVCEGRLPDHRRKNRSLFITPQAKIEKNEERTEKGDLTKLNPHTTVQTV